MTSKSIYGFKPTYLYIKRHSVTGKLYFGKTTKDPIKYPGSGSYWKDHIKKHGVEHVETLWYCLFLDQESCTEFALNFSEQQNIVKSEEWANFKPENGLDGNVKGMKFSKTWRNNISSATIGSNNPMFGKTHSDESKLKMSENKIGVNKGISYDDLYGPEKAAIIKKDRAAKMSAMRKNQTKMICPHCSKITDPCNAKRWHFDNCKSR